MKDLALPVVMQSIACLGMLPVVASGILVVGIVLMTYGLYKTNKGRGRYD